MIAIDRLAADLRKLGDRCVTELRKCVIIVAGLSADYEIGFECLRTTLQVSRGLQLNAL